MRYKPTLAGWIWFVMVAAASLRLYTWAMPPALAIHEGAGTYYDEGVVAGKPFWPQYWRKIRGLSEPEEVDEILRSDDGGLILLGIAGLALGLGLTYAWRRHLVHRR